MELETRPIAIVVHGGAGQISPERIERGNEGCKEAVEVGMTILRAGGSALMAVEAAVCVLEDNPLFNAGTGSCLTAEGNIEMDAGIMEGHTLQVGAVAGIELIKNPIRLAYKVLQSPQVMLIGRGAELFAERQGVPRCTREELLTERQYLNWLKERGEVDERSESWEGRENRKEKKHGTVGAVALDRQGNLAAGTSTGGIVNKLPGRVGDSPLIGCGFYADSQAAISCTGYGEDFVRLLIAKRVAEFVAGGKGAQDAAEAGIAFLGGHASGTGGVIVVDYKGQVGYAWNSEGMVFGAGREEV